MARTCKTLALVLAIANTIAVAVDIASAQTNTTDVYKVNYFSNNISGAPDAAVRIDNPGVTYGNLCAMVYVFDNDQQLAECCGCIETPDGLQTFSVQKNLTSNPLTGQVPVDGVIKIVAAAPKGSVCDPTGNVTPVPNLRAWVTHIENPVGLVYPITETESSNSVLGATEFASLQQQCAFVSTLGSGKGTCTCGSESIVVPTCSQLVSSDVTPNPLTLTVGQIQQLAATATFSDGSAPIIVWSSSNTSIATVSSSGSVTAVNTGTATIYATITSSTSCASTRVPDPITVNPAQAPPPAASCTTAGSLGTLLQGKNVTAYVPNGSWSGLNTGILVVPVEPAPLMAPSSIATPDAVNSCAANSNTGEAVCTANDTDVYLISGSILNKTLTSGATGIATFSGGGCESCGVAINTGTNTAVITIGDSSASSGSGFQFLNLATNTFSAPVPAVNTLTEDVVWDPGRNLILSPNENGTYDLFDTSKTPPIEYGYSVGGTLDSAGEDCQTGIALASDEYTSNLFITDLTQAKYKSGSPAGTWTAPSSFVHIADFDPYTGTESGTTGIAVAQGSHLGIVTGEFPDPASAGNAIIVVQLPSTSGSGTPAFVDWAVVALPNDPQGSPFSMGCDPHTVTAYVSPSTGRATGLVTDYSWTSCKSGGSPQYLGMIDLQGVLNAPRTAGTHTVSPSYNLTASGVVKFISAQ